MVLIPQVKTVDTCSICLLYTKTHTMTASSAPCGPSIRWEKGLSKFPSISPPSTTASLTICTPTTATPFVTTIQSQGTATHGKCPVQGCYQSCIAPDCGSRLCRRHCREAGGCSSKNHPPKAPSATAPVAPPMVIPPLLLPSAAPVPLGPIAHPLPSGHGLAIPSSQQLPLHHTLPVSPADSSFHQSTYYDNMKRWENAKQAVRDGVIGNKWSVFIMTSRKK